MPTPSPRKIIHVDMDAFYASVEQRDDPKLQGKPVIIGGHPQSRGVVASASYEARKFGVRSAMSCAQAHRLCPHAFFVSPNFEKYMEASRSIRKIFHDYTDLVEPLALDEAYLDVTQNFLLEPLAKNIAVLIKERIQSELKLTASAGIGPNKFIAKLASDLKKPNGLVIIPPEKVSQFLENLPVEKFWGVGPATAERLHAVQIFNAKDIRKKTATELKAILGSFGQFLFDLAHGIDERPVDPSFDPKSRGSETTFTKDTLDVLFILEQLEEQAKEVSLDLKNMQRPGRTISIKIKYSDFTSITRSRTLPYPTDSAEMIYRVASELALKDTEIGQRPIRLVGVSVSQLLTPDEPLQLWFDFY